MPDITTPPPNRARALASALLLACVAAHSQAQVPTVPAEPAAPTPAPAAAAAAPTPVDTTSLASLAWLEGCWRGAVNQREFREHWLPLRGGMMIGASHNVMQDKTQDYEYLRLESRSDGIHYVAIPSGKPPADFRLTTATSDDRGTHFVFANAVDEFPQRLVYHRGDEGWLYATIEGKLNGAARTATYPMRRVNCETGEQIRK
jgi:Domain of unknown function (DUF6265)